ncbi:MAG TPA: aminotransferase class V-fold PLP-dependent enzyme [Steroidobacteraceae bacterium]|nr:aminotransferase class V-fold PLP-dependent enzyme [Steroidobacteraceae bacterium]
MTRTRISLPDSGIPRATLEAELQSIQGDRIRRHWSLAFRGPPDVQDVGRLAYNLFLSDNGLFSLRTEYLGRIEQNVIDMCVGLFHAPADASGTFTSGGSESNFSAIHAMREWARERFPDVRVPEIIVPYSAHPTFSKGCHYFGLKLVRVPLRPDRRADVAAMERAINSNTIGLAGSAPCWPYGLIDPIESLGEVATRHGLWLHVDACVGGYLAPFVERLGHRLPPWDFRVPAVQSISADLHKYGYCPKPASTVLWRSESLKRFHYVHPEDWPGGPYHMQGFAGSRSAGSIFAAWTVLRYLGVSGYERLARQVLDVRQRLTEAISAIDGLYVPDSDLPPLAFGSHTLDMQLVMGELRKAGWILVAGREPPLINLPLDPALDDTVVNLFLAELRAAAEVARRGQGARAELTY